MKRIHLVFVLSFLLFGTCHALAENWPQFRGPGGQGHSTAKNLPLDWSATKNIIWKKEIPGKGWSSPIIYDGKLYLTTAVETLRDEKTFHSLRVLCLNSKSADLIWDEEVFLQDSTGVKIHNKNSHASPTPIIDGRFIYVHFGPHGTACLELTGKVIWTNNQLKYSPVHGNGGSPALVMELLIINCDGSKDPFIVALHRKTGKIIWKKSRPPGATGKRYFSFCTPLEIEVNGKKQVISPGSNGVSGFDPVDGREIWHVRYDGGYSVIPRPVYGHGLVFICTGYDTPSLLAIKPDGHGDVTDSHIAWSSNSGIPHSASLLLAKDELYFVSDNGISSCLDARTGEKHWKKRLGGNYSASPILADGKIYFQSEEGEGIVINADKEFKELSRNPLGERTLASYAISNGSIYIRSEKGIFRVGPVPSKDSQLKKEN